MFKFQVFILSIFITSVTHHWVADVSLPKSVEKRLQRKIQKVFDGEGYTKKLINYSDSLKKNSNSYFYLLENTEKSKKYILSLTLANGCKIGGCDINDKNGDLFETFYMYALYEESGQLVDLKILDYQSDYGYQITSNWWLKQFIKNQGESYEYSKNIDAISGATTSVKSTIKEMNQNQLILSEILMQ